MKLKVVFCLPFMVGGAKVLCFLWEASEGWREDKDSVSDDLKIS